MIFFFRDFIAFHSHAEKLCRFEMIFPQKLLVKFTNYSKEMARY